MMPVSPFCLLKFLKGSTSNFSVPESPGFVSGTFALEVQKLESDDHADSAVDFNHGYTLMENIENGVIL
jgi:hypothetical protein